jgi:hypothetical protein
MREQLRSFQAADPFGRTWDVEFRWLQNAISIRHADAVDLKYYISNGEERRELVVALPHPALRRLSESLGRQLTDPWCMRLGALHVRSMISTWTDMDKPIADASAADLERHNADLEAFDAGSRELAARTR